MAPKKGSQPNNELNEVEGENSDMEIVGDVPENVKGENKDEEDFEKLLTPAETLKALKVTDKSIEVIVSVSCIDGYKLIYSHKLKKDLGRFSFKMHSKDDNCQVQFIAWDDDAKRLGGMTLSPGDIVHVDGLAAKPVNQTYNKGTVPYQLVANSSTTFTIVKEKRNDGAVDCAESVPQAPYVPKFEDVPQFEGFIRMRGYIKTNFDVQKRDLSRGPNYICGSITDGWWKMQIQIAATTLGDVFLQKGQFVEVLGVLKKTAKPVYLAVSNIADISIVNDDVMDMNTLLGGWRNLSIENPPKKQRRE